MSSFDLLTREPVTLMADGKTHYTTLPGSCLTIMLLILILIYFAIRVPTVGRIEDADITRTL